LSGRVLGSTQHTRAQNWNLLHANNLKQPTEDVLRWLTGGVKNNLATAVLDYPEYPTFTAAAPA
jgi:hypothetical protein